MDNELILPSRPSRAVSKSRKRLATRKRGCHVREMGGLAAHFPHIDKRKLLFV